MIKNYRNIANTPLRKKALQIIDAGIEAIKSEKAVRENVRRN